MAKILTEKEKRERKKRERKKQEAQKKADEAANVLQKGKGGAGRAIDAIRARKKLLESL